jgi:serine protease Do
MSRAFLPLLFAAALVTGCKHDAASVAPGAPTASTSTTSVAAAQVGLHDGPTVSDLEHAFEKASGVIAPSVVSITNSRQIEVDLPEFLRPFTEGERQVEGMGSGVVLDREGHILTNNHVVEGATVLRVRLHDDRELDAEVVGADPKTDVAVIRVDAKGLQPAKLANSDKVRVGQWVIAAGSPFGLPRTITAGIVSAVGRGSMGIADYGDFIQTDAAINQGNSGGPLIDLQGRVIGLNTAIASRTGGSNGIGFAIPINLARNVIDQLLAEGVVRRGWIGIVMGDLEPSMAATFGYKGTGILVNDVDPKGPARKAGVKIGDIIVKLDGKAVADMDAFRNRIAQTKPGKTIELALWRGRATRTVSVKLDVFPGDDADAKPRASSKKKKKGPPRLGLTLRDPADGLRTRLGLPKGAGVLVTDVEPGSVAAAAGLSHGDVLLEIGDKPAKSAKTAQRQLDGADLDAGVRVRIRRGAFGTFVLLKRP